MRGMQTLHYYQLKHTIMSRFKGVVFALDFDGTCVMHEFPEIGAEVPVCIFALKWIIEEGGKIVLNTMRSDREDRKFLGEAVEWLQKRDVTLYGINVNPAQKAWTSSPKVYANYYIDDAAIGVPLIYPPVGRPYVDFIQVIAILKKMTAHVESIHGPEIITE